MHALLDSSSLYNPQWILFSAALDCRTLTNPENGRVNQMGNNFGDTATYTCNENFVLDFPDSETRTCMENDWSGEDPTCCKLYIDVNIHYRS